MVAGGGLDTPKIGDFRGPCEFAGTEFVLMSRSPRRIELLEKLGLSFRSMSADVVEEYPPGLSGREIPIYLSGLKADSYREETIVGADASVRPEIPVCVIAADTIVWIPQKSKIFGDPMWAKGRGLGKPKSKTEAQEMLRLLSGNVHKVITGVTLRQGARRTSFAEETEVEFYPLSAEEISYYIDTYRPYDKAGAYGIQEWIGMIGVKRIKGSFYNVMGLPIARLYHELRRFLAQ